MRLIVILFLLAAAPLCWAEPTAFWNCSITARLHGDADYYLRYGRDSWRGRTPLVCRYADKTRIRDVEITYNSASLGFGVNDSSVISLNIDLVISTDPADFQVYAYVHNIDDPAMGILWRTESVGILFEVNVRSDSAAGIQASLQQGNLYIR